MENGVTLCAKVVAAPSGFTWDQCFLEHCWSQLYKFVDGDCACFLYRPVLFFVVVVVFFSPLKAALCFSHSMSSRMRHVMACALPFQIVVFPVRSFGTSWPTSIATRGLGKTRTSASLASSVSSARLPAPYICRYLYICMCMDVCM